MILGIYFETNRNQGCNVYKLTNKNNSNDVSSKKYIKVFLKKFS